LKVQGDIAHNQNSEFELVLRQRLDGNMRRVAFTLPSEAMLLSVSRTRKNFSASIASLLIEVEPLKLKSLTLDPRNAYFDLVRTLGPKYGQFCCRAGRPKHVDDLLERWPRGDSGAYLHPNEI
jgi:hypothetical protein